MSGGSGFVEIMCTQRHSAEAQQQRLALSAFRCLHKQHLPTDTPTLVMYESEIRFLIYSAFCLVVSEQSWGQIINQNQCML